MTSVYFRIHTQKFPSFQLVSSSVNSVFGISEKEFLENGNLFWQNLGQEDKEIIFSKFLNSHPQRFSINFHYNRIDSTIQSFILEAEPTQTDRDTFWEGFLHTIEAKPKVERNYRGILENLPDMVFEIDSMQKIIYANSTSLKLQNLQEKDILNTYITELKFLAPENKKIEKYIHNSIENLEIRELIFQDNYNSYLRIRIVPEENGNTCLLIITDITKNKQAEETLLFAADHDSLTGLKNREFFLRAAHDAIATNKNSDYKFAIILFDVDRFQEINDSLGHMIGDELLKTVGNILNQFMQPENSLSRYGGDEFSAIVHSKAENSNVLDVFSTLMEISEIFSRPVTVLDNQIYTSISMGIAIYPDDGETPAILLQNADRALYYSKQKEYNSFTFYKPEMNRQTSIKRDIVHSLRRAIEKNEFILYYQPKIDLRNSRVSGAEALIRWNNNGNWISPMDFIPVAEESGLIIPIGKWVMERATADTKYLHTKGYDTFRMSVNISAKQFHVPGFGKFIIDLLALNSLSPEMFEVEITEGVAMKNVNLSEVILRDLDSKGIKISIDDFGTGHSSLAYLKKFPIDILKIDKTFIKDIPHDKESCAIVNAVLSMSHELDIEVVAEGVEENAQLEFLKNGGCEYIQGYYYSKPVPLNTLETFLEKYNG